MTFLKELFSAVVLGGFASFIPVQVAFAISVTPQTSVDGPWWSALPILVLFWFVASLVCVAPGLVS